MNHNQFAMQWWEEQERRKEESRKANEIHLVNNQLYRMIQELRNQVVQDESIYENYVESANRHLVSCSIWDIRYRNNFENLQVAVLQYYLIYAILTLEKGEMEGKAHYEYRLRQLRGQLEMRFSVQPVLNQYKQYVDALDIKVEK